MISFKEFLQILTSWTPIKVNIDKSIKAGSIKIGDESFKVENGFITLGDGTKIQLGKSKDNKLSFIKDGNEIQPIYGKDKKEKVKLLDREGYAYSRSDITDKQFDFLNIEEEHEKIIMKLMHFLEDYRNNKDIAALLLSSSIIKLEDKGADKNKNRIQAHSQNLAYAYPDIGRMIYNLFRSGILLNKIIPHLENLKKKYRSGAKQKFLIYWYGIIKGGYPTAYFMTYDDLFSNSNIFKELDWRFDRQEGYVDVYSRGKVRNRIAKRHCEDYAKAKRCTTSISKPYKLGYTEAIKIRIKKKE